MRRKGRREDGGDTSVLIRSLSASSKLSAKSGKGKKITNPGIPLEAAPFLADLPPYRTEYRFHQSRWRFDAAWPEIKLSIEFHGGVHIGGRYTRGTGFTKTGKNELSPALGVGPCWKLPRNTSNPASCALAARRLQSRTQTRGTKTMTNSIEMALRLSHRKATT